jgi:hypothetical protein
MTSHNLKHSRVQGQNPGPKDFTKEVFNAVIEKRLNLKAFDPKTDHAVVEKAKQGRFNQSNCAIALYSNAFSQKAMFPPDSAPFGYLHQHDGQLFSFAVYKRHDGGFFGSILPLSARLDAISTFSRKALAELPLSGVYVRFLKLTEYSHLVSEAFGFRPAKEEPWIPDAPEEDESLCHSKVSFDRILSPDSRFIYPPLRTSFNRGENFLKRYGLDYSFVPLTSDNLGDAMDIIKRHFEMIEESGKLVGSTHLDYHGLLRPEILSLQSVTAYLGLLNGLPVSVFICETNGEGSMGGYAGITLRKVDYLLSRIRLLAVQPEDKSFHLSEHMGISSLPTYAFARLFLDLHSKGYRHFYMGGSEHADIDSWKKRQMCAERDPTYWAVLTK